LKAKKADHLLAKALGNSATSDSSNAEWSGWLPIPPHQTALIEGQRCTLSEKAEKPELLQLWAGQSANLSRRGDATALLQSMVSEVTAIFRLVLR
jgi:hypothetical protein